MGPLLLEHLGTMVVQQISKWLLYIQIQVVETRPHCVSRLETVFFGYKTDSGQCPNFIHSQWLQIFMDLDLSMPTSISV